MAADRNNKNYQNVIHFYFQANERDIVGLTREEAVSYLTSLDGMVTLIVQYKKEGRELLFDSSCEKTGLLDFRPGLTQTGLVQPQKMPRGL